MNNRKLPAARSHWMDSQPKETCILADSTKYEPTKPSEPGSVGFEGAIFAEDSKIEAGRDQASVVRASAVLNATGVRIMDLDEGPATGVWSDLDGPEIRAALRTLRSDQLPVRYLDGAGIPTPYKVRRVEGDPVPCTF